MDENSVSANELTYIPEVLELPLLWHDEFDTRWKPVHRRSFHNRSHIEAVQEASQTYLAQAGESRDPLGLFNSLARWNEIHPEARINREELSLVLKLVFRTHDLGNIMSHLNFDMGEFKPVYLEIYTAGPDGVTDKTAEARSQDIAEKLISVSNLAEDQKARFIPLVTHLIGLTEFKPGPIAQDEPFQVYIAVMDQIGNDLFSKNEQRVRGLIEEIKTEDPNAKIRPYFFFNFCRERLDQLIPDKENQAVLFKQIWRKDIPPENPDYSNDPIKAAEV